MQDGRERRGDRLRRAGRGRHRPISRLLPDLQAGSVPTTSFWWPAAIPMVPWRRLPRSPGTGRQMVDIGKIKLDLPGTRYYEKELDVRFSRSYGPGRYDDHYELEGADYPTVTCGGPKGGISPVSST